MTTAPEDGDGPNLPSVSQDSLGEDSLGVDAVTRPSLFKHEPAARLAPIEAYYGVSPAAFRRIEIMEELKSDRFAGLYNLSFLFLCFSLVYMAIRNVREIGFQAGLSSLCVARLAQDAVSFAKFLLMLPPWLGYSYTLIWMLVAGWLSSTSVISLHMGGLGAYYVVMSTLVLKSSINPVFSLVLSMFIVVVSLKQHTWVVTNLILAEETAQRIEEKRKVRDSGNVSPAEDTVAPRAAAVPPLTAAQLAHHSDGIWSGGHGNMKMVGHSKWIPYPKNVRFGNFAFFLISPTLVYETSYPRTDGVRLNYLWWYLFQATVCAAVDYFLLMQFCVPVWRNVHEIKNMWYFTMKVALPGFLAWLLMFWGFFHCVLNALAEVTRFADRQFYLDWWNATTLDSFWRKWNVLVHEWCVRHLYVEGMNRHNMKAKTAVLGTFLFSAIMHEYVCLIGFRLLRPYMFGGMMIQIPLIQSSKALKGTRQGNILMWCSLFVGQTVIAILYVRDYLLQNGTLMC